MSDLNSNWIGNWRHLLEDPLTVISIEQAVEKGSVPAFSFYFLLACSAVIATLGLLANSAAVIIGAMIVAPLMNPIVSMSFGIVAGKRALSMRSILTVVTGTLLTIGVAFFIGEVIGWKLAGSEIVSRMKPSLLDLGVAVAAGAAAAFAYTRPNVSSALAGIAIAVALVPPLCTVGLAMALGNEGSADVGLAVEGFSTRGPFLLYLTNIVGIVLAAGLMFYFQYFRHRLQAVLLLTLTCAGLFVVIPPLRTSMDNLLVRNQIHRSLSAEAGVLLPAQHNARYTSLNVRISGGKVYVRADIVATQGLISQAMVDTLRNRLTEMVNKPVVLEIGIVPEVLIHSSSNQ